MKIIEAEPGAGIDAYLSGIQELQTRVIAGQMSRLVDTAARMADAVAQGHRIFVFGTGHSHMLAEEAFYRAGGLAAAVPVFSPMLMLHEGAEMSGKLERTPGLAALLLDEYRPQAGEMIFIFSNSGVNQLPVEMAMLARERGLFVVSVSSFAFARQAPLSSLGKRLDEIADIALDNAGVPGDALVKVPGAPWPAGPTSTIMGALIWNSLVCECVYRLQAKGISAPVFVSLNMAGAADHNQALIAVWRKVNPHLR